LPEDFGEVDAGLLENATVGQDARSAAAAAGACPRILAEGEFAIDLAKVRANSLLQREEVLGSVRTLFVKVGHDRKMEKDDGSVKGGSAQGVERNSKIEIRNPKQIRNPKVKQRKTADIVSTFSSYGFRICFGFRHSNFGFWFT
jgi:hypothetical protein